MSTTATPRQVGASDSQPPLIGERLLVPLERLAARLVGVSARSLRDEDNPLTHLGALSNFMLLVACVTGALLLFWYTPSHTGAYASVEAMTESPLAAGLLRTLHRYSSDAALLLAMLHGLQMFVQRRLAGPRKLAWVTGILAVFFLWLVGWLGYWLVWDERAQAVAVGTAKMLDVLPIFTDPISRSFLTDESVSSLLFFVVFFVHMLLPLLMVVSLWLHLARLARPRWMPSRRLSLLLASFIVPASSAGPAAMAVTPSPATIDAWYLLPLYLTERLSGGMLWVVFLGVGFAIAAAPWWLVRKRAANPIQPAVAPAENHGQPDGFEAPSCDPAPPTTAPREVDFAMFERDLKRAPVAVVDPAKCNACETCFRDCPYDAISMVPRSDGRRFPSVALVDPDRCVG
ncbi:MAG TPA: cytochrome b N-terminal domain-containing protein, partial [Myxococcota bacterium]|nr:cytochrome b N-terminal domain-containing protein [Myxococcota bacterium]